MAATENTYTQSGSTTNYSFTFPYLKQSDVKVTVAGETVDFGTESDEWQFDNATTIKFNTAPTGGAAIRIYRDTSVDDLTATFYAGSAIKSQDLNDNFNQSLYVTQEAKRDIEAAWTSGDETVDSTEDWYTTDDKKIATTKAIQGRLDGKQNVDTDLTNLSNCQTGGSSALAALTQTEIEILDGATVTTTELNYVDGVTSNIQTQLDARQDEDALLTAISGKDFKVSTDGDLSSVDTEIPSSKVVANHVTNSISAIGGFEAIDDEDNFPANEPVAGVIVSIADATGITVNSSGTSTTARTAGNGSDNVTINNFPASLRGGNGENADPFPLPNNTGLLVISTGSNHTYNFHRLLPTTDDVKQLSDDVNDFFARYRIANSAPNSANDDGDLWWDTSTTESSGRKMQVYDSKYNNNDGTTGRWIDLVTSGEAFINTLSISSGTGGGTNPRDNLFNGNVQGEDHAYRFTLSNPGLTAQHHIVSRSGVIQKPNAGTSQPSEGFAIDGNDIIFNSAPVSGTNIFVITIGSALSIGTPSDNTVTSAKIVNGAIVNDDINASADIALSKLNITGTASDSTFLRGDGAWSEAGALIKATASGDIAANKPVVLNTDGTVSQLVGAGTDAMGTSNVQITTEEMQANGKNYKLVYNPDAGTNGKTFFFWVDVGSGTDLHYRVGEVGSNNTITLGSEKNPFSMGTGNDFTSDDWLDVCYNTHTNRFILAYSKQANNNNYGYVYFRVGTYNSTNDDIDWGNEYDYFENASLEIRTSHSNDYTPPQLTASSEDGTACLIFTQGNTDPKAWALGLVTNSSNNNLVIGTHTVMDYQSSLYNEAFPEDIIYDPDNSKFIALWYVNGGSYSAALGFNAIAVSTSDGEITQSTIEVINNNNAMTGSSRIAYDPVAKYFAVVREATSGTNRIGFYTFTFGGINNDDTNLYETWGEISSLQVNSSNAEVYAFRHTSFFFNPDTSEFTLVYDSPDNNREGRILRLARDKYGGLDAPTKNPPYAADNGHITLRQSQPEAQIPADGGYSATYAGQRWSVYDTGSDKIIMMIQKGSSDLRANVLNPATPSNFNNQFLGYSTAQCNNGSTATIVVSSNTATESGLVPTATYYVKEDGTLTTDSGLTYLTMAVVKVGKAISSTKLLLT